MPQNELKAILSDLSRDLINAATASKKEADRSWPSSSTDDREMRKIARTDAQAIRSIASLVRAGRITEAYNKASGLDTIVREIIPDHFWDFAEFTIRLSSKLKNLQPL